MARTNVPLTALTVSGTSKNPSTTALDATNGHNIALASTAIPAGPSANRLLLVVTNTFAGSKTVTIKAGVNPPSFRKDIGDLALALAQNDVGYIGPFEPARFLQSDGSINIDLTSGMTGTILALTLPRGS